MWSLWSQHSSTSWVEDNPRYLDLTIPKAKEAESEADTLAEEEIKIKAETTTREEAEAAKKEEAEAAEKEEAEAVEREEAEETRSSIKGS